MAQQPPSEEEMKRLEEAFKQIVVRNLGSRKSSRWGTVMILSLLVILITVAAGYYLYKNKYKKEKKEGKTEAVEAHKKKTPESPKEKRVAPEGVKSEPKTIIVSEQ